MSGRDYLWQIYAPKGRGFILSKGKRRSGGKILTILWLMTAASALIVTIVYFGRIEKLYSTIGEIEAKGNELPSKNTDRVTDKPQKDEVQTRADEQTINPDEQVTGSAEQDDVITPATEDGTTTDAADSSDGSGETGGSGEDAQPESEKYAQDDTVHPYYYDSRLDPSKPIIALSFDDGPSENTKDILETLDTYGVKATFFMVGYQIGAYSDEVRAVYDAGCEIGNHTSNHKKLSSLKADQIKKEVFDNEELIQKYAPVEHVIVRPPYGEYNDTVKATVDRPMFNWSVDSLDWKSRDADAVFEEVKAQAKDGYIILCHDLYKSTADAVKKFVPWLLEQGYQVTCISNMFEARGEELLDGHVYRYTEPAPKKTEQ